MHLSFVCCRQWQGIVPRGFTRTYSVVEITVIYHEFPGSSIQSEGAASEGLNLLEHINSSYISQRAEIVFDFYIKIGLKKG